MVNFDKRLFNNKIQLSTSAWIKAKPNARTPISFQLRPSDSGRTRYDIYRNRRHNIRGRNVCSSGIAVIEKNTRRARHTYKS